MKPITLDLDNSKRGFLYIQLYNAIKNQILSGEISPNEKLPSLRFFSKELGISITTVELAYNQLLVEGYIMSRAQSGYYATKIDTNAPSQNPSATKPHTPNNSIDNTDSPTYIYDETCFDFVKWKKCSSRVFNEYSHLLLFESDPQGELMLRTEISKYIYRSRGVNASPERLVIGAGTQQITSHLSRILSKMGINLVSLEEPCYLPVQSMLCDAGFTIYHIPVNNDGIDISKLPTNISSCVYTSPSNQFPTGAVMPIAKRYELLEWAKANNSIIIEDDYDSELRYFGRPVPAMQGLDNGNLVVYLGSFSSTLFPAIKISYMVLPPDMAKIFKEIKGQYTQTCSKAEQLTLAFFMRNGYYYTGIKKLRTLYSQKLAVTLSAFSNYAQGFVTPLDTRSGITLTIKVRSNKKAQDLANDAKAIGIQMVPLSEITDQDTSALSFYYSQLPLAEIDGLIERLISLWKK